MKVRKYLELMVLISFSSMFVGCGDSENSGDSTAKPNTNAGPLDGSYFYTFNECSDTDEKVASDVDQNEKLMVTGNHATHQNPAGGCKDSSGKINQVIKRIYNLTIGSDQSVKFDFSSADLSNCTGNTEQEKTALQQGLVKSYEYTYTTSGKILRLRDKTKNFCDAWVKQ